MILESDLQAAFLLAAPAALPKLRLFRRNVSKIRILDPISNRSRVVRFALPGQCDLYGIVQGGEHFELELKSATGSLDEDQRRWKAFCEEWRVPYFLLKAKRDESKEQTVGRWIHEIQIFSLTLRYPAF